MERLTPEPAGIVHYCSDTHCCNHPAFVPITTEIDLRPRVSLEDMVREAWRKALGLDNEGDDGDE